KSFIMKTLLSILVITMWCFKIGYSQEPNLKLKYHSFSLTPLSIYFDDDSGGFSFNADLGFKKGKHIIKLFGLVASEFSIFDSKTEEFYEFDVLYGRELLAENWLYFDFFGGLGYFKRTVTTDSVSSGLLSYSEYKYDREYTIGFHLQTKIRFQTGRRFSLGIQFYSNINKINPIYGSGIFLQWKSIK
ncbi:MAG: hypothetical protein QNK20_17290, partial [Aureibaculum sp.]|nr:hypothetical protein [Aureibaculum sp.]